MIHDIGGIIEEDTFIDFKEQALTYWEQSIHAVLVVLSQKCPPLLTTDELRRAVEGLEETSYRSWGYYERWSVAMTNLLLERQVFTEEELHQELWGESDSNADITPRFQVGDIVQVRSEESKLRWRKPHLRCPGYIFNCQGRIEKHIGLFDDPFFLAFRGKGPMQHLYTVSFRSRDLWREGFDDTDPMGKDRITVEVYEGWLKEPDESSNNKILEENTIFSSNRGVDKVGSGDKSIFKGDNGSDQALNHQHSHSHSQNYTSNHDQQEIQQPVGSITHDHVHESRVTVECRAVENEGPETPGERIGNAMLRILEAKGVLSAETRRDTVNKLESFSDRLLGADLVVRAWMDGEFKKRLLSDAPKAALEVDVVTSNANAPTVLQVVECTPSVHHICVCTLCSCYPSGLLGLSPAWYRSRSYRSRTIREPRKVLAEFGTHIDPSVAIHVHDSTADCRFMVLPLRPAGTEDWNADQLRALVTRDSMIGISQIVLNR